MKDWQFKEGLLGERIRLEGGEKVGYVIAEAIRKYAGTLGASQASRLHYVAGRVESGRGVNKSVLAKCTEEIEVIRKQLVEDNHGN